MLANKDVLIISNPHADKGKAKKKEALIKSLFERELPGCRILYTQDAGQGNQHVEKAVRDGVKRIIAVGGDGTINEVASAILRAQTELNLKGADRPVLGAIPVGRGNDFAYSAQIPMTLEKAVQTSLGQEIIDVDVGFLVNDACPQGRFFVNCLGFGFEATVNEYASAFKKRTGVASYIIAVLKTLIKNYQPVRLAIAFSEKERYEIETQQISICNGKRVGGGFLVAPDASITDGKLNAVYAKFPVRGSESFAIASLFIKGRQIEHPYFTSRRFSSLTIQFEDGKNLPIHLDGEGFAMEGNTVKIALQKSALRVAVSTNLSDSS